ncbi:hypothetical protein D915_005707 [Fasciola hepatica]|uniref:STAS domain-containing protein n=1 Tax=Fasciola hepatica TaxID=6192 RepID=A0A4E0RB02_FASHE|nr:hypothetical protein D915_005707 [Fasciola hepatica]
MLDLPRLYRCSLVDLSIWVVSFLATVLVDIPYGLLIGFSYSLITILYRTHSTEKRMLGRVPGTNIYLSQEHFDGVSSLPGITLLQAAGPIYYVNADAFRNWLIHSTGIDPFKHLARVDSTKIVSCTNKKQSSWLKSIGRRLRNRSGHQGHRVGFSVYEEDDEKKEGAAGLQWEVVHTDLEHSKTPPSPGSKFIILDLSGCSFIDAVGADVLIEVIRKYNNCGIQILLSHCSRQVQGVLVSSEFDSQQLDKISFPTIHDAVTYAENTLSGSIAPPQDADPNTEGSETVDKTFRF